MKRLIIGLSFVLSLAACSEQKPASDKVSTEPTAASTAQVKLANEKDPSCGMAISPDAKDTAHYKGKVYGFCSESCKNEFVKDPAAYVKE